MKRQIICYDCAKHPAKEYAGEWVKRVYGFSKRNYTCDLCGKPIFQDERCVAESFGTNRQPYSPWEYDFIHRGDREG